MTGPDMATITTSLERSLRDCSINGAGGVAGFSSSSSSDSLEIHHAQSDSLDLNSQISLPYHWEQCLDLKTGEVYYMNWRTGMKAKEDPRTTGDFYSEDDEEDDHDGSYDDSEESSSEASPSSYSRRDHHPQQQQQVYDRSSSGSSSSKRGRGVDHHRGSENVLVVAGCKSCLMYFMVPKQDAVCPKCCGQLLHFDHSENGSL